MQRDNLLAVAVVACALGVACAGNPGYAHRPPPQLDPRAEQALGPNAVIEVRVLDEPELTSAYRVLADGTITYPFCGRVQVAGRAPAELEAVLRACLSDFVLDPQLSVLVKDSGQRVTVLGMVEQPGSYPYQPGLTATEAVALAGGLRHGAREGAFLSRRGDDTRVQGYFVSLAAIARGEVPDVPLAPGDQLQVPEQW